MVQRFLTQSGGGVLLLQSGGGALLRQPDEALAGLQPLGRGTHNGRGGLQQVQDGINQFAQKDPGGGGAFTYDAVNFDGSTYLTLPFADLPWSAGRQLTLTGFFKTSNTGAQNNLVFDISGFFQLYLNVTTGRISFFVFDPTASSSLSFDDTLGVADGTWHSWALALDTNFSAGNKLCKLLIDKNLRSPTITDTNPAFDMALAQGDWLIGSQGGANNFTGDMSELTINTSYVDFTSGANIAKFFDGSNKPVDLGSDGSTAYGSAAKEYHHIDAAGTPADFALNRGGGAAWTINGSFSLASTKP